MSRRRIARFLIVFAVLSVTFVAVPAGSAAAVTPTISVDASGHNGFVSERALGQMAEVGTSGMNGAWAEKLHDRSLETDSIGRQVGFHDLFTGGSLDRSTWTPTRLDTSVVAGSISVAGGLLGVTAAAPGRFGVLSGNIGRSSFSAITIEARIADYTGQNAIVSAYGGAGTNDFSHNVEFGVEAGNVVVFADGLSPWTGSSVTLPADFRIVIAPDAARTVQFYVNGSLVHTISGYTGLPAPYRVFLYGHTGTANFDRVSVTADDTYDGFGQSSLSGRWSAARLAGSIDGSLGVSSGMLTVVGGSSSRYGALSEPVNNSSVDWTSVQTRLYSYSGTNALISIYGGDGGFEDFVEFGIEDGVSRVFTSSGPGGWTGGTVALPATLEIQVSTYWANGRNFRFLINGSVVHEIQNLRDVPPEDFRIFLYGYGASTTTWDWINVIQRHQGDLVVNTFDETGALNGLWAPETLAGSYGSISQSNGQAVVIGAAGSRYGILSKPVNGSDVAGYSFEAKLDSVTGTNGLFAIYGGSGRGDFSDNVEFGVEGGVLKVFGDGLSPWTGGSVSLPALLRVDVSAPDSAGNRDITFFHNGSLVHSYEGTSVLGGDPYRLFLYGYGATTSKWDYLIRSSGANAWSADGHAGRATYVQSHGASRNGYYGQRINITDSDGRVGISQPGIAVVAGHSYQVSVYLRGTSGPATIMLGPDQPDGPSYAAYDSATTSSVSTSVLTKYTLNLTSDTTDTNAKLFIGTEGTGTLEIDMASMMPLHSSEVTLGGWRADFVQVLQDMKLNSIRWPGGIIADWYHWADGVGPRDDRPPTYYGEWDPTWVTNDVGTHEILDLAEALDIEVDLNVNWGTGTAGEAADWVSYANDNTHTGRTANGRSAPWEIQNWRIGNETWGFWTPGWVSDATTFASSYATYAAAMLGSDEGISLMADGDDGSSTGDARNTALLATGYVDHIGAHIYAPQRVPQGYTDAEVFAASNAVPAILADILAGTEETILQNTSRDTKAAMTEYSPAYLGQPNLRTQSLEGALQVAGMVNYFLRRPDLLEINDISGLVNLWEGGGIRLENRGLLLTPSHHVMSMQANHHGNVLLPTAVTSDTFSTAAMGNMPARADVPYLDVTSTKSADGGTVFISVVNRHPSNAFNTAISLSGAGTIDSSGTAYTLNSASYLDQNTWDESNRIEPVQSNITGVGSSFSYPFPAHSLTILELDVTASGATTPAIAGYVFDEDSLEPVAGATVSVSGGGSASTGANGRYVVPVVGDGTYSITVSKAGFNNSIRTDIEVAGLGATANSVPLSP